MGVESGKLSDMQATGYIATIFSSFLAIMEQ